MSYLSNQGFIKGRPPSWETGGLSLKSDSITILMLLFRMLSGWKQTGAGQFFGLQSTSLKKEGNMFKQKYSSLNRMLSMIMVRGKVHAWLKTIHSKLKWTSSREQYLLVVGPLPPLWGQSGSVSGHWPDGGRLAWWYWWCSEPQDYTHLSHSCLVRRERIRLIRKTQLRQKKCMNIKLNV